MKRICQLINILFLCLTISYTFEAQGESASIQRSFDVRKYGAIADGQSIDTQAIQRAIDACYASGGGRVVFTPGTYLSGTIRLQSGVVLFLEQGARLVGTVDLAAYSGFTASGAPQGRWNRGLIVGENLRNIAIMGSGTIDGNRVFDPQGEERMRGPHTVLLFDCQGVALHEVTFRDSANYAFLFYACVDLEVENVTFEGGWDGVHFRGVDFREGTPRWNRNVRIRGCKFYTGDDCIAGHYIENGLVEDCIINSSCNGVRLIGPAKDLTFRRCDFFGPGRFEHRTSKQLHRTNMLAGLLIQPSAWTPTPGPLEDLHISDITMCNVACALHIGIRTGNTGKRVTCERLRAVGVYSPAVSVESWADEQIEDIILRDIDIAYTPEAFDDPRIEGKPKLQLPVRRPGVGVWNRKLPAWGFYGRNVNTLHLDRIRLQTNDATDSRPVVLLDNVRKGRLDHLSHSPVPPDAKTVQCQGGSVLERDNSPETPLKPRMKKGVVLDNRDLMDFKEYGTIRHSIRTGLRVTVLGRIAPGLSVYDEQQGTTKKWDRVKKILGADAERVIIKQLGSDLGGNTSVRNEAPLIWKDKGYFRRARDLGQVFTAPRDFTLYALVLRTGNAHLAFLPGAAGAEVFVQFFEVTGTPVIDDNGTPPGTPAKHGFSTNHRCDDFVMGVGYEPMCVIAGGTLPDLAIQEDGKLTYMKWAFTDPKPLHFEQGKRYAFMVGFVEPAPERNFTLANRNSASSPRPPVLNDAEDTYPDGWGLRREGSGKTPPLKIPGDHAPTDPGILKRLQTESTFPPGYARFMISPTCEGYPDVDTYRDLEFYLIAEP